MSSEPADATPFVLTLSSRTITRVLTVIVLCLLGMHLLLQSDRFGGDRVPWELQQMFDLDEEQSVPNWYSSIAIALAAVLAWAIGSAERRQQKSTSSRWRAMGWVLLYLSFDEVAGIHETVNSLSPISWTIPFGLLALVVGAWMLPFVLKLPRATRTGTIISGIVYIAGAVGVEIITSQFFDESNKRQMSYALNTVVEEGLEMFGIVILIRTLLRHMEQTAGAAAFGVRTRAKQA